MMKSRAWILRLLYMVHIAVGMLLGAEITLRLFVSSDPSFYVAFSDPAPGTVVQYPYGEIVYNADGFADSEFDQVKTKPRVGYLGDSVCFGVGAGHGYRVSERMESAYPQYEHMNLTGGLGGGTSEVREKAVNFGSEYDLDAIVYMMNLNDIRPDGRGEQLQEARDNPLFQAAEWFRGRSYLYTYLRQVLKELMNTGDGPPTYEMYPQEHREVLEATAARIYTIQESLEPMGIRFVVLIVPYEMQVSAEAERVYTKAGTQWEDGFIEGQTQSVLREEMQGLLVVDGLDGFLGKDRSPEQREKFAVGEAFVYNLGERLDWNHPNRLGHRLLAEALERSGALDGLTN